MRTALLVAVVAGLVLVGPAAAAPPVVLSASPTQVTLVGSGRSAIQVVNAGRLAVHLKATISRYSIAADGRIEVGGRASRSAEKWLTVVPGALDLAPGGQAEVTVRSRVPTRATPGDAHALVLLTTDRVGGSGVGIRTRLGIGVLVRVPGQIRRRLVITGARVIGRRLRIGLANRGNLNERLARGQVAVTLRRRGRAIARLRPKARNLLPRSRGYVRVRLPRKLRGRVAAFVRVRPAPPRLAGPDAPRARTVTRKFRLTVPSRSRPARAGKR